MNKKNKLFLDDIREVKDAYEYTKYSVLLEEGWDVVRNYDQFCQWITSNGLPSLISFDHDLADEHYTPQEYWHDYHISEEYQLKVSQNYQEKTGYDCAKWLINYCLVRGIQIPKFIVHSQNPVGKDNIYFALKSYEKYCIGQNKVS